MGNKQVWHNRIVRYSDEAPDQLLANPANWRTHSGQQADALRGVLSEVGIVQNVIANVRTGFLIDGHLRVMEAMRSGQPTIPVTWVDLSPDEERLVLATLDPLSALAGTDAAQLEALLSEITTGEAGVMALLDSLAQSAGIVPLPEPGTQQEPVLASECLIEIRCSQADLDMFRPILADWKQTHGVTINIS